jgi:hypothetical protein
MTDRITDERLAEIGAFKHIPGELIFEVFMYLVNEREHSRNLEEGITQIADRIIAKSKR